MSGLPFQLLGDATNINHNVLAHAEVMANVLGQYEAGEISLKVFQIQLDVLLTNESEEKEHQELYEGTNVNYNQSFNDVIMCLYKSLDPKDLECLNDFLKSTKMKSLI